MDINKLQEVTLTVKALYTDEENCVCCDGFHRYATHLLLDGELYSAGDLAHNMAKNMPTGSIIHLSATVIES